MALQLSKELPSGLSGNYWRVTHLRLDRNTSTLEVRVGLYKDAAGRAAGKAEMDFTIQTFGGATEAAIAAADSVTALAYVLLKATELFTEAVDV